MTITTPGGPHHERTSKFAVISNLDLNKEPDASVSIAHVVHRSHKCIVVLTDGRQITGKIVCVVLSDSTEADK